MNKLLTYIVSLVLVLMSNASFARQDTTGSVTESLSGLGAGEWALLLMIGVVLFILVVLLLLMIYLLSFLQTVMQRSNPALAEEPSWWENFKNKFVTGDMTPVEDEEEIMLEHNYDGIRELDNYMPPWLRYLFSSTLIIALGYLFYYSGWGWGMTPLEEYESELAIEAVAAEERKSMALASIDETNVAYDQSDAVLSVGASIYNANCVACHAADGGGGVGPNFTDEYWLHGGSIHDVFKTVKYGVPEKGMIPWQDQLSPEEIMQVSNFILSLKGKPSANPKEPQGEIYTPEEMPEMEDASSPADSTLMVSSL